MSTGVRQYIRQLKRNLRCCGAPKKRLLEQFREKLGEFLEETSAPDAHALLEAFGPPEEMARILMEAVTPEEKAQYRRRTLWLRGAAAVLTAAFLAFTVYIYIMKEIPMTVYEVTSHDASFDVEEGDWE